MTGHHDKQVDEHLASIAKVFKTNAIEALGKFEVDFSYAEINVALTINPLDSTVGLTCKKWLGDEGNQKKKAGVIKINLDELPIVPPGGYFAHLRAVIEEPDISDQLGDLTVVAIKPGDMLWEIHADEVPAEHGAESRYRLSWGWTAGMSEEELANYAEDAPVGHDSVDTSHDSLLRLRDRLTELLGDK